MMTFATKSLRIATFCVAFVATPAMAAQGLGCIEKGATDLKQSAVEAYVSAIGDAERENAAKPSLFAQLLIQARFCADRNGWSEEAFYLAAEYRQFSLKVVGLERSSLLSAVQMSILRSSFSGPDHDQLRQAMEPIVLAGMANQPAPALSFQQQLMFAKLANKLGTGGDHQTVNNFIGAWLGAKVAVEHLTEKFSAQP